MKLITLAIAIITILVGVGCQSPPQDTESGEKKINPNTGKPYPDNYLFKDAPTWVPEFDVPPEWKQSPSYAGLIRSTSIDYPSTFISFTIDKDETDPAVPRDALYEHQYCEETEENGPYNIFADCSKGFKRETEMIGGHEMYILHYYGTWRSKSDDVVNMYYRHPQFITHIEIEGSYEHAKPIVEQILPSLKFEWKVPDIRPDEETRGGL